MQPSSAISRRDFMAATGAGIGLLSLRGSGSSRAEESSRASDEVFLDLLQRRTFDFFWETTNRQNGLVPDRWPSGSAASIAAVGFGLVAYGVGAARGYVTRADAAERVLATLRFFAESPQSESPSETSGYRGFYYHFLDMNTGRRAGQCELSSIDTALLIGGVLFCREYFDRAEAREREIRELADGLYQRVEWTWMQPHSSLICMAWRPERGFGAHEYKGYDEAMLLYLLALGSPTHAVAPDAWSQFASTYQWGEFYGQEHLNFGPLFGHQYSHVFVDFRRIQDTFIRQKGIDYFENSRRAALSQRAYAIDNPGKWRAYGEDIWGLTACDGPTDAVLPYAGEERQFHSYWARGASLGYTNDDGTIAPTAAGGSIPFAPEITIGALKAMRARYGDALFAKYGFLDSFNPSFTFDDVELKHGKVVEGVGWVDDDYLGIDQGPILLMAENFRSELVWDVMRRSPYIRQGLERANFRGGWLK